jgi:hypothetical protein
MQKMHIPTSIFFLCATFFLSYFFYIPHVAAATPPECENIPIQLGVGSAVSGLANAAIGNSPVSANESVLCAPKPRIKIPGLSFTNTADYESLVERDDEGNIVAYSIPFLGQYIAALYQYSIALAGIVCVLILIISGVQWTLYGANPESVDEAKTRIQNALTGLILTVSSYTILYTIDPNLVLFKSLRVGIIEQIDMRGDSAETTYNTTEPLTLPNGTTIIQPSWSEPSEFDCQNPPPAAGVIPENNVVTYRCDGCNGSITTISEMQAPMCQACALAKSNGYEMQVLSTYRPYARQVELWCTSQYNDLSERRRYVSLPGYSNHGNGIAVDIALTRNGETLTGGINSQTQCNIAEQHARALFDIFINANQRFVRYKEEIWHFELAPTSNTRIRTFEWPSRCQR